MTTIPELKAYYRERERELIFQALTSSKTIAEAARKLGINRTTLVMKLKKMGEFTKYIQSN